MPIVKHIQKQDYTVIDNACLRDIRLDLECRGLLVTMLSLPDNWNFTGRGLATILPCGKGKIFKLLSKLEELGYLKREEVRGERGRIADTIYYIAATPMFAEISPEDNSDNLSDKFEQDFSDGLNTENFENDNLQKDKIVPETCADTANDISTKVLQDNAHKNSCDTHRNNNSQYKENICCSPCPTLRDTVTRDPVTPNPVNADSNKLYNNKINTNKLKIDQVCNNQSINQSKQDLLNYDSLNHDSVNRLTERLKDSKPIFSPKKFEKICLHHLDYEKCKSAIKQNIAYEILSVSSNTEILDEIVDIMANIIAFAKTPIKINGDKIPAEIVAERFMSLGQFDIEYVLETLNENTTAVKNIRAYLITTLYNSKSTLNTYYQTEMQHDFYGSG